MRKLQNRDDFDPNDARFKHAETEVTLDDMVLYFGDDTARVLDPWCVDAPARGSRAGADGTAVASAAGSEASCHM